MIEYYLGIPGSGKTYSAVNTIYNNFTDNKDAKKDLKKGYISCFTNINEFKFDLTQNVYKFDFDEFLKNITILHDMYKKKCTDDELILKSKEFNIYKSLFVLDECHQYFDVEKRVFVWWLTYHRHLYHDIILITQNLALVNAKYKPLAESFFRAKPDSLTLNKKFFNYTYFTEKGMTNVSKVGVKKVLRRQSVFNLYKSGDVVHTKNVIKKFLFISLFFILILVAMIFYFYRSTQKDITRNTIIETTSNRKISVPVVSKDGLVSYENNNFSDFSDKKFLVFECNLNDCISNDIIFPTLLFKKFVDMEYIHIYKSFNKFGLIDLYYVYLQKNFYDFIHVQKGYDESNSIISDFSIN